MSPKLRFWLREGAPRSSPSLSAASETAVASLRFLLVFARKLHPRGWRGGGGDAEARPLPPTLQWVIAGVVPVTLLLWLFFREGGEGTARAVESSGGRKAASSPLNGIACHLSMLPSGPARGIKGLGRSKERSSKKPTPASGSVGGASQALRSFLGGVLGGFPAQFRSFPGEKYFKQARSGARVTSGAAATTGRCQTRAGVSCLDPARKGELKAAGWQPPPPSPPS